MTDAQKKEFRSLTDKYGLSSSDFHFNKQGWAIINRRGIEKIQAKMNLSVTFQVIDSLSSIADGVVTIKATVEEPKRIETYGEANNQNTRGGASAYPVAMAEKRALSRIVLKASDFYKLQVLGEYETEGNEDDKTGEKSIGFQRVARVPRKTKI